MPTPPFAAFTGSERALIAEMYRRMKRLNMRLYTSKQDFEMDLSATSAQCPLDLTLLASFDNFNFVHDVAGICRHLDRPSGKLKNHFFPRCAKLVPEGQQ